MVGRCMRQPGIADARARVAHAPGTFGVGGRAVSSISPTFADPVLAQGPGAVRPLRGARRPTAPGVPAPSSPATQGAGRHGRGASGGCRGRGGSTGAPEARPTEARDPPPGANTHHAQVTSLAFAPARPAPHPSPPFRCGVTSWRCWNPRVPPSPPTLCPRAAPPTRPCSPPWRGSVPRRSGKRGRDPSALLPRPGAASGTPPLHVRLTPRASKPGLPLPLQADRLRWRLQRRAHSLCTDQGGSLRGVLPRPCGGRRQG